MPPLSSSSPMGVPLGLLADPIPPIEDTGSFGRPSESLFDGWLCLARACAGEVAAVSVWNGILTQFTLALTNRRTTAHPSADAFVITCLPHDDFHAI